MAHNLSNGKTFLYEVSTVPPSALQVGPEGKVIGIDHIKELVDDSITNVKKDDPSLITTGRVKLIGRMALMKSDLFVLVFALLAKSLGGF